MRILSLIFWCTFPETNLRMKLLVFISGTLASMQITFGILFKLLHLPGANELLLIGMTLFGFVFIPSFAVYLYRRTS